VRVYVASSWRNDFQPSVVTALRADGHEVYDFRDADGFHWSEVDPNWKLWTPAEYLTGLLHPCAIRGFERDMKALEWSEACVYVMPCGPSASMEMGWARGTGRYVVAYVPALREPDLMVKMAHVVTDSLEHVRMVLAGHEQSKL
jgi:hypothetical protein